MALEFNTRNLDLFEKKLRGLTQRQVHAGVSGQHHSGETNATIAYILEQGRSGSGKDSPIPPRPAFKDSLFKMKSNGAFEIVTQLKYTEYLNGQISQQQFLKFIGNFIATEYREGMKFWYSDGSTAKHNAPSTIKQKGFDKPFIDEGELVKSVDYEVI